MAETTQPQTPSPAPAHSAAAGSLLDQGRDMAAKLTQAGVNRVKKQLDDRKTGLAVGLLDVSQVLLVSGNQVRDQGHASVAEYAAHIAERLGRASGTLRQKDIDALLDDAQSVARRRPALVFTGAALLGLAGARLVKSGGRAAAASATTGDTAPPSGPLPSGTAS